VASSVNWLRYFLLQIFNRRLTSTRRADHTVSLQRNLRSSKIISKWACSHCRSKRRIHSTTARAASARSLHVVLLAFMVGSDCAWSAYVHSIRAHYTFQMDANAELSNVPCGLIFVYFYGTSLYTFAGICNRVIENHWNEFACVRRTARIGQRACGDAHVCRCAGVSRWPTVIPLKTSVLLSCRFRPYSLC
jgi:hypothetical protein